MADASARDQLVYLRGLADTLLRTHSGEQLDPYIDDIADAHEGLCAVADHLATPVPEPVRSPS